MKEEASEQRADLSLGLLQGSLSPNELNALNSAIAEQASNLASFNTTASIAQRQLWNNSVSSSFVFEANAEETQAIATAQGSLVGSWRTSTSAWMTGTAPCRTRSTRR